MLYYAAAPAFYVDVMHGTLIERMGGSHTLLNLPVAFASVSYLTVIVLTWLIPHRRLARHVVVASFGVMGLMGSVVALALVLQAGFSLTVGLLLLHALLTGMGAVASDVFTWEILSKGMSEETRGKTLAWAFGTAPLLAVGSSLFCDFALKGNISWLGYPYDYAMIFGLSFPIFGLAALFATRYHVPAATAPETRRGFVEHTFGGLWNFVRQRTFILVILGFFLLEVGLLIKPNAAVHTREAMGIEPKTVAGLTLAVRFGGKILAGFLLGFLAARRGAKAGAIATAFLVAAACLWALTFDGTPYLGTFVLLGAGELAGVYYPNYCVSASKPEDVKRNVSFFYMIGSLVAGIAVMHGAVADSAGIRADFFIALAGAVLSLVVTAALPRLSPVARQVLTEDNKASQA
jgi:hypothetical protein